MQRYSPNGQFIPMSRQEVQAVDDWAINEISIPGVVLMENAGRSCSELIREKLSGISRPKVCIFCGGGNNGGDGYVIARHLINIGIEVKTVLCADKAKIKGDAKINLDILEHIAGPVEVIDVNSEGLAQRVEQLTSQADMLVDSLLGTGLTGRLKEPYIHLIEAINSRQIPIAAVDIPSGLDCDAGLPLGAAIRANYTITFVAMKKGFLTEQAADYTGEVYIASIGIEPTGRWRG